MNILSLFTQRIHSEEVLGVNKNEILIESVVCVSVFPLLHFFFYILSDSSHLIYIYIYIYIARMRFYISIQYKSFLNRSIWNIDTDITTRAQNGPWSYSYEGAIYTPYSDRTEASPTDAV